VNEVTTTTEDATKAAAAQGRATLERATREYDLAHRTHLASEIIKTIVRESRVSRHGKILIPLLARAIAAWRKLVIMRAPPAAHRGRHRNRLRRVP
jgi:hypothetical protein